MVMMPAQMFVRILVRAIVVLMMFVFGVDRNSVGVRRGREIKDGQNQQGEREKFFHNGLSAYTLDCIADAMGCKELSIQSSVDCSRPEKDYLSLMANWRKF
jgi:hypothetical protein